MEGLSLARAGGTPGPERDFHTAEMTESMGMTAPLAKTTVVE
jgi:hypothetical protein